MPRPRKFTTRKDRKDAPKVLKSDDVDQGQPLENIGLNPSDPNIPSRNSSQSETLEPDTACADSISGEKYQVHPQLREILEEARKKFPQCTNQDVFKPSMVFMKGEVGAFSFILTKYGQLYSDYTKIQHQHQQNEKQLEAVRKEKGQLQQDLNKNVLLRCKFGELCRELQKQNKEVKDENVARKRESDDMSTKFQNTLKDITELMTENTKHNQQLKEDNNVLRNNLNIFTERFDEHDRITEEMTNKRVHQKEIEMKVAEAQHTKRLLEVLAEREKIQKDVSMKEMEISLMKQNFASVEQKADLYHRKYSDLFDSLTASTLTLSDFKDEMLKTQERNQTLQHEAQDWKQKFELCNKTLIKTCIRKEVADGELKTRIKQVDQLEKLCRALNKDLKRERMKHIEECAFPDHTNVINLGYVGPVENSSDSSSCGTRSISPIAPEPVKTDLNSAVMSQEVTNQNDLLPNPTIVESADADKTLSNSLPNTYEQSKSVGSTFPVADSPESLDEDQQSDGIPNEVNDLDDLYFTPADKDNSGMLVFPISAVLGTKTDVNKFVSDDATKEEKAEEKINKESQDEHIKMVLELLDRPSVSGPSEQTVQKHKSTSLLESHEIDPLLPNRRCERCNGFQSESSCDPFHTVHTNNASGCKQEISKGKGRKKSSKK